jgi:accessory gene regulator protein AgrB
MTIYDRALVNFYNYYGQVFSQPNRYASIQYITTLQLGQLASVSSFFGFIQLINRNGTKQAYYICCIIAFSLSIFNVFFYNQEKLNKLLLIYSEYSDAQKKRSRIISIIFSIITLIGWVIAAMYMNYLHEQSSGYVPNT